MRCKAPLGLVLAALLVLPGAGLTARAAYLRAKGRLAEALIRRAWSETLASGRPTPPWRGADTYPIGRLLIPRLGYDEVVLEGASPRVLAFGPARLVSAAAPGEPGNVVLAGHRTSWFRPLQDVRVGDLVELVWRDPATGAERRRRYAVRRLAVVRPEDVGRRLRPTADDRLTLVTCYPFGRSPQSPLRLLVTAEPSPPRAQGARAPPARHTSAPASIGGCGLSPSRTVADRSATGLEFPVAMQVDYIVLAIPVFFALIGLELVITRLLEKDYYRLSDSLSDLSCGMVQQLLEVFVKTALFAGYLYLHGRHRLLDVESSSMAAWALCFLGVDFLYYWFHRLSHEVNAFWAAHVVHHQSEDFNLAVALRQGALQGWFSWIFYLPLAVIGFPPLMFLAVSSFNTLYQFWIHTRAIGRLGPLEWVLNTPSNHRVHHGRNPKYIDRNHGGTLIVWDRLFGTYQAEEEEPVYGITTPLRSWNPIWANAHVWVELVEKARRTRRFADRLRLFVKPPGWQPAELGGFQPAPEVDPSYRKWDTPVPGGLAAYALVQFVAVLLGTALLLFRKEQLPAAPLTAGAAFAVASLVSLNGLLELRPWAFAFECGRLAVLVVALAWAALHFGSGPALAGAAAAVLSAVWLLRYRPLSTATSRVAG